MNLTDGAFLCLDIGSFGVRAVGCTISFGRIKASHILHTVSSDASYAVKSAIDMMEEQLGTHFDSAFVTGNFGDVKFDIWTRATDFGAEHKITNQDIFEQIFADGITEPPLHIIPLRYDLGDIANVADAVGQTDRKLSAVYSLISYDDEGLSRAKSTLREAHLESAGFFDPMFLLGETRPDKNIPVAFIDFGAEFTSVSVWTARGPMMIQKIKTGGADITNAVAEKFGLSDSDAERLKISAMSMKSQEMDRFTPADARYEFSRADINDVCMKVFAPLANSVAEILRPALEKYHAAKIYAVGGGSDIPGMTDFLEALFGLPAEILGPFANVNACAQNIWQAEAKKIKTYLARRARISTLADFLLSPFRWRLRRCRKKFIPIMPSTAGFDMRSAATYAKFNSAGISMLHVDVMDGFYVERIQGGIDEIRFIRAHTKAHLHVHLMTENAEQWAANVIAAGADTVIVSAGTNGVMKALREIKAAGKRAGIALHPASSMEILAPILRDIDEVLVMSIIPGASGRKFLPEALPRIRALNNTRKKHNLKFKIAVDGGINPTTAKQCWAAGADFLASDTYLSSAPDFAAAVQSLIYS